MKQTTALKILQEGHNVFLTGSAGAGKSYTLRKFIEHLHKSKIKVAVTASSGVAATILGGSTVHSYTCIGIKSTISATDIYNIRRKVPIANRLKELEVLIIDEVSMLHARQLDMINYVLKSIRKDFRPFGGVQVVVAGDFFQLPPVGPEAAKDRFAFMSRTWIEAAFKVCYLTEQHRQTNNNLNMILNAIREDKVSEYHKDLLKKTVNNTLSEDPTKLFTHNQDVDALNRFKLSHLSTPPYTFHAVTEGSAADVKFLNENVLSPPELTLKVGARVMFTKNHNEGLYVNGTLGTVVSFTSSGSRPTPVVRLSNGSQLVAEDQSWEKQDEFGQVKAKYTQIPLRLAWAITCHKSQGLTLDEAEINLSGTFELGQGYVALSRLRDIAGLRLLGMNDKSLKLDPLARKADERFQALSDILVQEYGEE